MRRSIKKLLLLLLTVGLSTAITCLTTVVKADTTQANAMGVQYEAHVQSIGWQESVKDGAEAGTDGKSLRVEALKINLANAPEGASIKYQAHVQSIGWQDPVKDGAEAGTDDRSLRVEALKISLENLPGYSIEYRVQVQRIGWMDWVYDGQSAGTQGQSLRIEAIEIKVVKVSDNTTVGVQYQGHVQNIGLQDPVQNGQIAGTEGQGLRVEALKIGLLDAPVGAKIDYQTHVQSIGWQDVTADNKEAGTEGKSLRIEALKIALENLPGYSVQYRVQVQHIGWMPWVSDGVIAGTIGKSYRIEGIDIRIVKTANVSTPTPIPFIGTQSTINATSVSLNKTSDILTVGSTDTLAATVSPANATNKNVTWKSSNTNIATVDSSGEVTAVSAGTAIITATTVNASKTARSTVTVNKVNLTISSVSPITVSATSIGKVPTLPTTVNVTLSDGTTKVAAITWDAAAKTATSFAKAGTVTVNGTLNGYAKYVVNASIIVKLTQNLVIDKVLAVSDVSVVQNAQPVLPSIIDVIYKDGTAGKAAVTWGTVSTSTIGLKKVVGKIYGSTVTASINVNVIAVEYVKAILLDYYPTLGAYLVNVHAESNVFKVSLNGSDLYYDGNNSFQISTVLTKGSTVTFNVYDSIGKLIEAKKYLVLQ